MGREDEDEGEEERDEAETEDGTRSPVLSLLHLMNETRAAGAAGAGAGAAGAGGWGSSPPGSVAGEGGHREWLPPQAGAPPPSGGQRRDKGLRSFSLKVGGIPGQGMGGGRALGACAEAALGGEEGLL